MFAEAEAAGEGDSLSRATLRSASEAIEAKAIDYLAQGRLTVRRVVDRGLPAPVVAQCQGSADKPYVLGYDDTEDLWHCSCPALHNCAHLTALKLVVNEPK